MNRTTKSIIAVASLLLAFGSANAVTASAAAAAPKQANVQAAKHRQALEHQRNEAYAVFHQKKKPGDLTVMYDGTDNSLSYNYLAITSSDYGEYTELLSRYKAPELKRPAWLPDGYAFDRGEIVPPCYFFLSEPYQQMLKEIKAEAKGKIYYAKKLAWSEAGEADLVFAKGSDMIRISASKVYPLITKVTQVAGKGETIEHVSIEGTDALYVTNSNAVYSNYLKWQDEKNGLEYKISTYENSPLTKEQFAAIAKSMIGHR